MTRIVKPGRVGGRLDAPPSKSSTQRAIACALLAGAGGGSGQGAPGESLLIGPGRSEDCRAALRVAEALGAAVVDRDDSIVIRGVDPQAGGSHETRRILPCGESGTALRVFAPIAALFAGESLLVATGSLMRRPMSMIEGPLRELGASCQTSGGLPPVLVSGRLRGGKARVDGRESSQLLSGLLIALPLAREDSVLAVESLASAGYVDLTIATMRAFGIEVETSPDGNLFRVRAGQSYRPREFSVEGDWSGAAFPLVAAAIAGKIEGLEVRNLPAASMQPDRAIVEALRAAGASVEQGEDFVRVGPGDLRAFDFDARSRPDLFPPLVALAAFCRGLSTIRGAERLGAKESDRATALAEGFGAIGVRVEVEADLMRVSGGRPSGGRVDSRGDHRIAMAAAIAALGAKGAVEILGSECVAKSWPGFFEDLAAVTIS